MRFALLAATLTALGLACSGTANESRTDRGDALLLTVADGSIAELSLDDGEVRTLVEPPPGGQAPYPGVSPDGAFISYAVQTSQAPEEPIADAGFDLWVALRDGSAPRRLFEHEAPNQQVIAPQWQEGGALLAIVQEPSPQGIVFALERFDVPRANESTSSRTCSASRCLPMESAAC